MHLNLRDYILFLKDKTQTLCDQLTTPDLTLLECDAKRTFALLKRR